MIMAWIFEQSGVTIVQTIGDVLREDADRKGLPLRTLDDVRTALQQDKKKKGAVDVKMARLMLRFGRLTDEARAYVEREYPQ